MIALHHATMDCSDLFMKVQLPMNAPLVSSSLLPSMSHPPLNLFLSSFFRPSTGFTGLSTYDDVVVGSSIQRLNFQRPSTHPQTTITADRAFHRPEVVRCQGNL